MDVAALGLVGSAPWLAMKALGYAAELLLDLRLNRIFVTNDVFTLHRSGLKRFEVDFTNNDGSVGGRRDCRDESLQCCPYVVVRSLGQPNLVRKVRPPSTVLLS